MNTRLPMRMMLLAAPLLLVSACSDDPAQPDPAPEIKTTTISSSDYLNHRFIQLDLPGEETNGRVPGEAIDFASIRVYQKMGPGTPAPDDIPNVVAYVDSTGFRDWDQLDTDVPFEYGSRWRKISTFQVMLDVNGNLLAIDLGRDMGAEAILACTYEVWDADGTLVARVGDNPATAAPGTPINGQNELFYKMKLLKARANRPDPHVFRYILRNIYSLGNANIDHTRFDLRIEENNLVNDHPEKDEQGVDFIRIFGLDRENNSGEPGADGIVDFYNYLLFDLQRGLLIFPLDFPAPFAASPEQYVANVDWDEWEWDAQSYLAQNLAPELYSPDILPGEHPLYSFFNIIVETGIGE